MTIPHEGSGSPGGWLIKDFADGWFWTPHRITAVTALTDGHVVWSVSRQAYESDEQTKEEMK